MEIRAVAMLKASGLGKTIVTGGAGSGKRGVLLCWVGIRTRLEEDG